MRPFFTARPSRGLIFEAKETNKFITINLIYQINNVYTLKSVFHSIDNFLFTK